MGHWESFSATHYHRRGASTNVPAGQHTSEHANIRPRVETEPDDIDRVVEVLQDHLMYLRPGITPREVAAAVIATTREGWIPDDGVVEQMRAELAEQEAVSDAARKDRDGEIELLEKELARLRTTIGRQGAELKQLRDERAKLG